MPDDVQGGDSRRPAMTFRVGVTGATRLPERGSDDFQHIRSQIDDVLAHIHARMQAAQSDPLVQDRYRTSAPGSLRCASALAEGADRVFAEAVLDLAEAHQAEVPMVCLEVVLPFAREAYTATFSKQDPAAQAASVAEFEALIARAKCGVFELDGDAVSDLVRPRSYGAAGRTIVRNVDLLVAVWDDAVVPKGQGGTSDAVHFALRAGVPVWWIKPKAKEVSRLLTDPLDLQAPPREEDVLQRLTGYLNSIFWPPQATEADGKRSADPLLEYYREPLRMSANFWLVHAGLIGGLRHAGERKIAREHQQPSLARTTGRWKDRARHVLTPLGRDPFNATRAISANLSEAYQHRYRTTYTIVLILGALALFCGVLGLAFYETKLLATIAEIVLLFVILGFVMWSRRGRWHEKYVSYRLLREVTRGADELHALGWSLPFGRVRDAAGDEAQSWMAWLLAAHAREATLPDGAVAEHLPEVYRRIEALLNSQISFHSRRERECEGAAQILERVGSGVFKFTLVVVIAKLALMLMHIDTVAIPLLALLCVVLPALAAGLFGIRAYEEFTQLAEQSRIIRVNLQRQLGRVQAIDLNLPLASQRLAATLLDAASTMLSEVGEWAQLFRLKAVEA